MKNNIWTPSFSALIFIAVLVSMCVSIIIPTIPLIMKEKSFSYDFITYAFVSLIIGRFIASNTAGYALVRYQPHKILLIGFLLHIITMYSFTLVDSQEVFTGLRFLEGIFEGIVSVCLQTILITISTKEDRGRKMGYFFSAYGIGFILGPAVGGIALTWEGINSVFISVVILMIIGLIWLLFIYKTLLNASAINTRKPPKFNLDFVHYLPFYSGAILQRGLYVALSLLLPLFLLENYNLPAYQIGFYFTTSAIITSVLMSFAGHCADKKRSKLIAMVSMTVMGLSIIGFSLSSSNQIIFTILFIIETIAFSFMVPSTMKIFGNKVENHPQKEQIIGTSSSSREILNVILIFTLVPIYKYSNSLPWLLLGLMCLILMLPYLFDKDNSTND